MTAPHHLVHVDQPQRAVLATREQVDLLKRTLGAELTDDELALFAEICRRRGLDPFAGQIHATKRDGRLVPQVGIDGFRGKAEETGLYAGQLPAEWCGTDGDWRDVWLAKEPPWAARVGVLRRDWDRPAYAVAHYDEYVQRTRDGGVNRRWRQAPAGMLAKCAEALALRKAFPQHLSGLYTDDEMGQADNPPEPVRERTIVGPGQVQVLAINARNAGLDDDARHTLAALVSDGRTASTRQLYDDELQQAIVVCDLIRTGHASLVPDGPGGEPVLLKTSDGTPVALPLNVHATRTWLDSNPPRPTHENPDEDPDGGGEAEQETEPEQQELTDG